MDKRLINILLFLLLTSCNVKASEKCMVNKWFESGLKSRDINLDLAVNDEDKNGLLLSQLPSLSLSAGKGISKAKDSRELINVRNYIPQLSASLNLYSGGRVLLDFEENALERDLLSSRVSSERNIYVYNLLSAIFLLKTIISNKKEITDQIKILKKNEEVYKYLVESGKKPRIELELISSGIEDLMTQYTVLNNNYNKLVFDTKSKFSIPENELININYSDFNGCVDYQDIQMIQREYKYEKLKKDIHIKRIESQLLPDVTLSTGASPVHDETKINYHRLDYQVSVALTFNLASVFKLNNDKQIELMRFRQKELHYEDAVMIFFNKKNEVNTELKNINLQIDVLYKSIAIEERKLNYVKEQLDSGRESFLYYMDMLNQMLSLKSRVSGLINQRDYYEVLSNFYN